MSETIEDRQKNVWIASQRYVNGDIEIDELEKVETINSEILRDAILTLSKWSVQYKMVNTLLKIFGSKKNVSSAFLG